MEELLIDEKKYLSTKRAAKVTGYAKDYIGQLCREGRVKARQVGRSWYVLESDIREHRFGTAEVGLPSVSIPVADGQGEEKSKPVEKATAKPVDQTWEAPKYAPIYDEPPQLNLLKKESRDEDVAESAVETNATETNTEPLTNLNEAWEAWFSNTKEAESAPALAESTTEAEEMFQGHAPEHAERTFAPALKPEVPAFAAENSHEAGELVEESVPIIRKAQVPSYPQREKPRIDAALPREVEHEKSASLVQTERSRTGAWAMVIRLVSVVCALGILGLAYLQIGHHQALLTKLPSQVVRLSGSTTYQNTK